jgi:hypothetical protein
MPNLAVTLSDVDAAFKPVMMRAFDEAVTSDLTGTVIDKWLADQLKAAFLNAFGAASGLTVLQGVAGDVSGADSAVGDLSQNLVTGDNAPAQDARNVASVLVTATSTVTGFSVDVRTDSSGAIANLLAAHTPGALKSIFRQVPKNRLLAYLPADASGSAVPLTTRALPLVDGDSLEFVFDIDVNTAGAYDSAGSTAPEDLPQAPGTNGNIPADGPGSSQLSLNMANRRVALKIVLADAERGETVDYKYLKAGDAEGAQYAPGAGTNPATADAADIAGIPAVPV